MGAILNKQRGCPGKGSIFSIQLLRWIAASLVLCAHCEHEMVKVAVRNHGTAHITRFVEFGIGVDIFFVISGFLLYHVSRTHFGQAGYPLDFLGRRVLRVIPLYWLASLAMLAATVLVPTLLNHNVLYPAHSAASFLMIAWPDSQGRLFPLLNSGWTLNLEFYFYTLFAIALRLRKTLALSLLIGWLAATVVLDQVWPGAPWWFDFYTQPIVLEFAIGIILCTLYWRGVRVGPTAAVAIALFAIALHIVCREFGDIPRLFESGVPAALVFFACVFCTGLRLPARPAKFAVLMGDASYALYLTSPFVINLVVEMLSRIGFFAKPILLPVSYACALLVAVGVFRWVEMPIARASKQFFRGAPTDRPAVSFARAAVSSSVSDGLSVLTHEGR